MHYKGDRWERKWRGHEIDNHVVGVRDASDSVQTLLILFSNKLFMLQQPIRLQHLKSFEDHETALFERRKEKLMVDREVVGQAPQLESL